MKSISTKKKIRHSLETAIISALKSWKISDPSEKMRGLIRKASKKLADQTKGELKKISKKVTVKKAGARKATPSKRQKSVS